MSTRAMNQKVIIHARGVGLDDAVDAVRKVMRDGRISSDGESYCYVTTFPGLVVSTDKPRQGTNTYTFYVLPRRGEQP